MNNFNYFDESYFQNGKSKGTVYSNYLVASKTSKIYKEIVEALIYIYKPKKVLEIGCATGIMVKYFNEAGIEAHGIDVSEWAIKNREHPNVILASAADLPYKDKYFDLVFSCHSIEHIPNEYFLKSLNEISRVCSKIQVHFLPLVGTHPFIEKKALIGLRNDPTHNQLHSKEYWLKSFQPFKFSNFPSNILFKSDGERSEQGFLQFALYNSQLQVDIAILERLNSWNLGVYRFLNEIKNTINSDIIIPNNLFNLEAKPNSWVDFKAKLNIDIINSTFVLFVYSCNKEIINFRIALTDNKIDPNGNLVNVLEKHISVSEGYTLKKIELDTFMTLRGTLKIKDIELIIVGGKLSDSIQFSIINQKGENLLSP